MGIYPSRITKTRIFEPSSNNRVIMKVPKINLVIMSEDKKTCDVKGCNNTFKQKATGRLRITKKQNKGEAVAWICPPCSEELEETMEWRK